MHFKASIDNRVEKIKMPENLSVGMMVRAQREKCQPAQYTS